MTELRCSRDLAEWLGAVWPTSPKHHRALKQNGNMLVRDRETGLPLFWHWVIVDEGLNKSSNHDS